MSSELQSPFLDGFYCYLFLCSVHPPPTLVSHPELSWSARLLSHSFLRSVSSCGPHHAVQGLHTHQRGQSVSCVYLIRRWWLLQGLSLHHPLMASPEGMKSPSRSSGGPPWVTWRLSLPCLWPTEDTTVFGRTIWRLGLSPSVLGHFLLFDAGLGLDIWNGLEHLGPLAPQYCSKLFAIYFISCFPNDPCVF